MKLVGMLYPVLIWGFLGYLAVNSQFGAEFFAHAQGIQSQAPENDLELAAEPDEDVLSAGLK